MDADKSDLVLTIIDTTGIQPYIFGTNVLRQSIGASGRVHWATNEQAARSLLAVCGAEGTNVRVKDGGDVEVLSRYVAFPPEGATIDANLRAEWIYAGGGNTVILFEHKATAKEFAGHLSRILMEEAPGLGLVIAHRTMGESDSLAEAVDLTMKELGRKKRDRRGDWSAPLLGLGVTADCQFTGLPATAERAAPGEKELQRVSAAVVAKEAYFGAANGRMQRILADELSGRQYRLLNDFDDLGSKGEASYMAVVHIDGNGMGKRVARIADVHREAGKNREYIDAMRRFSDSIEDASNRALNLTVASLVRAIENDAVEQVDAVQGKEDGAKVTLPFRPVVYGGDDITFVCDGRHALALAQMYLKNLSAQKLDDKEPLYVRAGVAVVKTHYPFARAYELAESLAKSAKNLITAHKAAGAEYAPYCALDWHFGVTGLVQDLKQIRAREYTYEKNGDLVMRPVFLETYDDVDDVDRWRTWGTFTELAQAFQEKPWVDKRSQWKTLRETLRRGPTATENFINSFGKDHQLPMVAHEETTCTTGWGPGDGDVLKRCAWSDVLEALDLFVSIPGDQVEKEGVV